MTTPTADRAMNAPAEGGIAAADAHAAAEISYRQLDHWARQGWVRPSINLGEGRWAKRRYAPDDIIRLDLLRHLAMSKMNAAVVGPEVAKLEIPGGDVRIIWGPVASREPSEPNLRALLVEDVLPHLEGPGAFVVYNPARVRRRIKQIAPELMTTDSDEKTQRRRTA